MAVTAHQPHRRGAPEATSPRLLCLQRHGARLEASDQLESLADELFTAAATQRAEADADAP